MNESNLNLSSCLYFNVNNLSRVISRLAEEEFRFTGLSPSHAFVLMLVNENPGIHPFELSEKLRIAPSTITRFLDNLELKGYLSRSTEGKNARVFSTEKGKNLEESLKDAWKSLNLRYSDILGEKYGDVLTKLIHDAISRLENIV